MGKDIYNEFSLWLDKYLDKDIYEKAVAVNFNLYEGADDNYHIEVIWSDEFDESDSDWACSEIFTTRDDVFHISRTKDILKWEEGLEFIKDLVNKYLANGKHSAKLKVYQAVGIGFVDGDLEILYKKDR
jgi:hypothetical protein